MCPFSLHSACQGLGWSCRCCCCRCPVDIFSCCFWCPFAAVDAPFGLALLFDRWSWGDGALGVSGWPRVAPSEVPTEAALQAAADAVRAQADAVRALKTQQGLGNRVC
jgi:hypothetical protein